MDRSAEAFEALESQGKTIIYQYSSANESPGSGWEYVGRRSTPDGTDYCWGRIVTVLEAAAWEEQQAI